MSEGPAKKPPRFGGARIRSWGPKSRTGCLTCKRRRVKCDEQRPACRRCITGHRECEGYEDAPAKTWTSKTANRDDVRFPPTPASTAPEPDLDFDLDLDDAIEVIGRDRKCTRCGLSHIEMACPSNVVLNLFRPSDSPYHRQDEQYLFKFFVEVAGASVSRSNISAYYWLGAFPQIAYETQSVRDCLLAVAASFYQASGDIFVQSTLPSSKVSSLVYEGRAMRSLSRGNPSTYEVLNTSMAFWVTSMVVGNWGASLQHLYYCLKIINGLTDHSSHDQMQLKYQAVLARIGLSYFRITRGPCQKHGPGPFLACDADCFIPEDKPFEHRIADALYHLRAALPTFELCLDLLRNRMDPHSHREELESMLDKEIREIKYLIATWSDLDRLQINRQVWAQALSETPYTASGFDGVLSDLVRYIVNDQYSTGIVFQELELRTRVAIPHIVASTSRGAGALIQDCLALILYSGYTEGLLKVKGNFDRLNPHIRWLMDKTRTLAHQYIPTMAPAIPAPQGQFEVNRVVNAHPLLYSSASLTMLPFSEEELMEPPSAAD